MPQGSSAPNGSSPAWAFWIDRGGTFTDVVGRAPDGRLHVEKLLSQSVAYPDAAVEGIARLLRTHGGPVSGWRVGEVRMGTTVATNALLERRGEPTLLAITAGHADALAIGWQSRPRLFDLNIVKPEPLYADVIEIEERVGADGEVLRALDEGSARARLQAAFDTGLRSAAIVFMHGYRFPAHEAQAARIAREVGFTQVSASYAVAPLIKLVSRGDTAVADAYLSPVLSRYVEAVRARLGELPGAEHARLLFMQSNGGLTEAGRFRGKDAVLSGPAGGVVGMARAASRAGFARVIGFDMGGTSTDVSRYAGAFERAYDSEVAGVRLRAPMMRVETVAAGGGSICRFEGGRLRVGPQSAGADPGPAAYGRGGPLTVTDCNFILGKLQPDLFPYLFGPDADAPPSLAAALARMEAVCAAVAAETGERPDPQALAEGFVAVAVENMARAIRRVSVQRGYDPADHALASFGGAGGQHACLVADALGMTRVVLHPLAGVLSAYGMGLADLRALRERSMDVALDAAAEPRIASLVDELAREATAALVEQGAEASEAACVATLLIKYAGTDTPLPILHGDAPSVRQAFEAAHRAAFGFASPERGLIVEAVTVEAVAASATDDPPASQAIPTVDAPAPLRIAGVRLAGEGRQVPLHHRDRLAFGVEIAGPAVIAEATGAVVVEPGWRARVDGEANLILERVAAPAAAGELATAVDPLTLELFASRFMGVAQEMGYALQNTATSVNIKERLDFSCAVFDATGALIANAPHIPVHLGSMGDSVRAVIAGREQGRRFVRGDAYALNAPYAGGTHLPDITVVAPVFDAEGALFAFVAARGHHADVGGLTPGSMPPDSRAIRDEGVMIEDLLLMEGDGAGGGRLCETQVRALLASGPYPARNVDQNLADLKAQVAACAKGAGELLALVAAHGRAGVEAYMGHVQDNAEAAVRTVLATLKGGRFTYEMDSGAVIAVEVRVDAAARTAVVDFTGTSAQLASNFNAPAAIARAAVLYVFRTLVEADIPLNDGCLRPITIVTPEGSMLNPRFPAAVVAGNVETSQAVVDALYGALGVVAASQGTMNNLTFGDSTRQYYETICGGAGAGPTFDGADAVQTHMTNSRLTDPEVLETRFPVRVERFAIRRGSGGAGAHRGGDGVVRRLVFTEPMTVAILANRRRVPPFGVNGGKAGALGATRVERVDGSVEPLASTDRRDLAPGDAVVIETPGGGGFGAP